MLKSKLLSGASIATVSIAMTMPAQAQSAIDEVVVTARKKAESLQDVPIAVSALDEKLLDELGIDVFSDYLLQMPGITAGGSGPGQNTIYIRGVASTTPNLTTAGVAGLAPNVALYLDEQPLTQPGRNLDVYAVDMERVEILAGPQGTLFGASSQAGVVRLITNKPEIGEYSNFGRFEASYTPEGDPSHKIELVSNSLMTDWLSAPFCTKTSRAVISTMYCLPMKFPWLILRFRSAVQCAPMAHQCWTSGRVFKRARAFQA